MQRLMKDAEMEDKSFESTIIEVQRNGESDQSCPATERWKAIGGACGRTTEDSNIVY